MKQDNEVIEEQSIEETQDRESHAESINEAEETNNFFKQLELKHQTSSTFHRDRRQNRFLEHKWSSNISNLFK